MSSQDSIMVSAYVEVATSSNQGSSVLPFSQHMFTQIGAVTRCLHKPNCRPGTACIDLALTRKQSTPT